MNADQCCCQLCSPALAECNDRVNSFDCSSGSEGAGAGGNGKTKRRMESTGSSTGGSGYRNGECNEGGNTVDCSSGSEGAGAGSNGNGVGARSDWKGKGRMESSGSSAGTGYRNHVEPVCIFDDGNDRVLQIFTSLSQEERDQLFLKLQT